MDALPKEPTLTELEIDSLYDYTMKLINQERELSLSPKIMSSLYTIRERIVEAAVLWYGDNTITFKTTNNE